MNVLELIQRFTNAVGLPEPTVAVANQADDVIQMVELLNQEGRELSRRADWQALTFEQTFTTVATESQGALTSLITGGHELRKIVNETIFNRTTKLPIYGPVSRREWQARQALTLSGPISQYRVRGNELILNPAPAAGDTCAFEFVSKCWCSDSTGATFRRNITADTDEVLLDDEVMLAGIEWRWLRKKGLSYAEEFASYEGMVRKLIGDDGTKRRLNMAGDTGGYKPGIVIPIGDWPL
jgi:hypothetical protein